MMLMSDVGRPRVAGVAYIDSSGMYISQGLENMVPGRYRPRVNRY